MFLWINLYDQGLISAWYGKHGLCLLFYHDTVSLREVFCFSIIKYFRFSFLHLLGGFQEICESLQA